MYEEFIFPYEKPIMERFGLNCYGCCEPLHGRWPASRGIRVSAASPARPGSNVEKMAGYLGDKYIFSLKPNPAALAVPEIDEEAIRRGPARRPGKDPRLLRGNHHEGQPHPGPPAGKRRDLVPDRKGRSPAGRAVRFCKGIGCRDSRLSLREGRSLLLRSKGDISHLLSPERKSTLQRLNKRTHP